MKLKKKIVLWVFHILVFLLIGICVLKYSEEIVSWKAKIYYKIQTAKDNTIDVSEYPVIKHSGNEWYHSAPLIWHAAGGIDGISYTNSKEALENSLEKEHFFIEIDFLFTEDGNLVCAHDWEGFYGAEEAPTLEEFSRTKVYGKYTPLTAEDLIQYMREYSNLHIIIDTKEADAFPVVQKLVDLCGTDSGIIDRFIIQLYDIGTKSQFLDIYPFKDDKFLFTAYKFGTQYPNMIMDLCYTENISIVTVPHGAWDYKTKNLFISKGFILYEHTVNHVDDANASLGQGIYGFYTDFLTMDDLF